jgi:hypothetical protein
MKVSFLIIGAQKGGSTWLYDNIRVHPQVFTPKEELHYFSSDANYQKGEAWYHRHFEDCGPSVIYGEKTPEYLPVIGTANEKTSTETHLRIRDYNKDMKLIVVLREPVSRLQSAVTHMYRTRRIAPWVKTGDLIEGKHRKAGEAFSLLEHGKYYENLSRYLEAFPPENVKILFFETDVLRKPVETLESVCSFLGITFKKEYFPEVERRKNENQMSWPALMLNALVPGLRFINNRLNHIFPAYKPKMASETRIFLQGYYRQSNQKLKQLTGYLPDNWVY